jgi:hypothetical protein
MAAKGSRSGGNSSRGGGGRSGGRNGGGRSNRGGFTRGGGLTVARQDHHHPHGFGQCHQRYLYDQ